jgi:hypothetical protein
VKRPGGDEPIWVEICMYMETTQEISLNNYMYLKLEKMLCFLIIFYVFSSTKSENKMAEQVLLGSRGEGGPNNVYTCK